MKILSFDSKTSYWSLTLKIYWWQNFHSRWRSFWVIANQKSEKFGREDILCPRAIFSVFSIFFLHQYIYIDYISRHFSIYHLLLWKKVQKIAAKLKFGEKTAIYRDAHKYQSQPCQSINQANTPCRLNLCSNNQCSLSLSSTTLYSRWEKFSDEIDNFWTHWKERQCK